MLSLGLVGKKVVWEKIRETLFWVICWVMGSKVDQPRWQRGRTSNSSLILQGKRETIITVIQRRKQSKAKMQAIII